MWTLVVVMLATSQFATTFSQVVIPNFETKLLCEAGILTFKEDIKKPPNIDSQFSCMKTGEKRNSG